MTRVPAGNDPAETQSVDPDLKRLAYAVALGQGFQFHLLVGETPVPSPTRSGWCSERCLR